MDEFVAFLAAYLYKYGELSMTIDEFKAIGEKQGEIELEATDEGFVLRYRLDEDED